jgi:hypothetical protein
MRPYILLAVLCLPLLVAGPLPAADARPHVVRGTGISTDNAQEFAFTIAARSTPRRTSGHITYAEPANQLHLTADVTCLAVAGKSARLTGKLRRPLTIGNTTFTDIQFEVRDGGPPQQPSRDGLAVIAADRPLSCARSQDLILFSLTGGNIRVR